jgi:MFS family permease
MAFTPADQPATAPPVSPGTRTPLTGTVLPDDRPRASASYVWLIVLATFGVFMAFVTPLGISLAIKVSQLSPANEEYLGYITGVGGLTAVVVTPMVGRWSDRTRSRLGRRRPYLLGGTMVGLLSLVVMAAAPNIPVLGLGWMLAQGGWGAVLSMLLASQSDRLPSSQRGRVAALCGVVQQFAPVTGVLLAGTFAGNNFLIFLVPGAVAVVAMVLFVVVVREPDSRELPVTGDPLTLKSLVATYTFSPRRTPDFAWNWLGKFLFMFGLTLNTTFTAFFLSSRIGISLAEVATLMATISAGGIAAAMLGALGGGFLSDRLGRRRIFVLLGAGVFSAGAVLMALTANVPVIVVGSIMGNLGIGLFSAVDQALALDVLPDPGRQAGRYLGVYGFSSSIPQGIAPFIAPVFLAVGATGGEKNYTLLYLVAAALTLIGGLIVQLKVKSVR